MLRIRAYDVHHHVRVDRDHAVVCQAGDRCWRHSINLMDAAVGMQVLTAAWVFEYGVQQEPQE